MPIYRLGDAIPQIDPSAWVADNATVIGRVTLGPGASVWFGAVLRADNEPIVIGARSNVQENAVLHTDPGRPLTLGDDVTIGHLAMLHGCHVGDGSLIGIQATLLNGATIGRGSIVGAGTLVTEDKVFADAALLVGSPAVFKRTLTLAQVEGLKAIAAGYVERARRYRDELVRIG
jgi:carbonic anhydrase/acetyltransferase-like protein (isoleucine patch superfamily)